MTVRTTRERFEEGRLKRYSVRVYRIREMCEITVETWNAKTAREIAMKEKNRSTWRSPDTKYISEVHELPRVAPRVKEK
jgi:hypothetical protein